MAFKDTKHKGFVSNYTGNGIHSFGAFQYFQINDPNGTLDPYTGQVKVLDIATKAGFYSSTDTGSNITEVVYDPYGLAISTNNATLNNITVWSDNSILTQGRADTRYQANGSYLTDNITPATASYGSDSVRGMRKSSTGAYANFVAGTLSAGSYGMVGMVSGNEVSGVEFNLGDIFNTVRIRQYKHNLLIDDSGISVEFGTANWSWTANHTLTQGRGDARYQPVGSYLTSANLTWSNITGKPTTLSGYGITDGLTSATAAATYQTISGMSSYLTVSSAAATYLPSANFTYDKIGGNIPIATANTAGAIKVGANLSIANGVLSANGTGGGGGVTAAKAIAYSMILGR